MAWIIAVFTSTSYVRLVLFLDGLGNLSFNAACGSRISQYARQAARPEGEHFNHAATAAPVGGISFPLVTVPTRDKILTVWQDHFVKAHRARAIPIAIAYDRYAIARFERFLAPTLPLQPGRAGAFRYPCHDVAVFVGSGEGDLCVRIGPIELRDRGFERGLVGAIVHGHRVMGKRRPGQYEASDKHCKQRNDPGSHRGTSQH